MTSCSSHRFDTSDHQSEVHQNVWVDSKKDVVFLLMNQEKSGVLVVVDSDEAGLAVSLVPGSTPRSTPD